MYFTKSKSSLWRVIESVHSDSRPPNLTTRYREVLLLLLVVVGVVVVVVLFASPLMCSFVAAPEKETSGKLVDFSEQATEERRRAAARFEKSDQVN